jgi:hypothetical protein
MVQFQEQEIVEKNIPFERDDIPFLQGFFYSVKGIITKPREFFSAMHVNKGFGKPFLFYGLVICTNLILYYLFIKLNWVENPITFLKDQIALNGGEGSDKALELLNSISDNGNIGFKYILYAGLFNLSIIWVIAYLWHLLLTILNVARNGFEASFRILAYSSAPLLLTMVTLGIPLLNLMVFVWIVVVINRGISEAHEVDGGKPFLGTMALPLAIIFTFTIIPLLIPF